MKRGIGHCAIGYAAKQTGVTAPREEKYEY